MLVIIQVSVGRLGIITRLKLPIVPQAAVKRILDFTSIDEFAKELVEVQEDYKAAKAAGTPEALKKAFLAISEVQVCAIQLWELVLVPNMYLCSRDIWLWLAAHLTTTANPVTSKNVVGSDRQLHGLPDVAGIPGQ